MSNKEKEQYLKDLYSLRDSLFKCDGDTEIVAGLYINQAIEIIRDGYAINMGFKELCDE